MTKAITSSLNPADGLPILDALRIIQFKAKAWLDLPERKANGGQVDSKHITKHINDVIDLTDLPHGGCQIELPEDICADLGAFVAANMDIKDKLR
ncbi:MAG: hypothetical protein LBL95_07865 [Deltaproteobacteria bacterium]|nr:hypothetical protein [Deltaproteobacteria bacterium]